VSIRTSPYGCLCLSTQEKEQTTGHDDSQSGFSFEADLDCSVADSPNMHMRVLIIAVAIVVMIGWGSVQAASVQSRPTAVNFNFDKSRKVLLWHGAVLGYVEEQDRFADGTTRRSTVLYAGKHHLKVPLPVEIAEIAGPLAILAFVCGIAFLLGPSSRQGRPSGEPSPIEPDGAANGSKPIR
jgi:hypothetical protein